MLQRSGPWLLGVVVILAALAEPVDAIDRLILGKRLDVVDSTGLEAKRRVNIDGSESSSDITTLSNPTTNGATLEVIANGGTSTHETYLLDAAGWQGSGSSYKYKGPTGGDGDPVLGVQLKRSASGTVRLKTKLRGNVGIQDLEVVPPNPGDDGGIILTVTGGDRYCVAFGAGAGGSETRDTPLRWKLGKAAAQPGCPGSVATTTTTTLPGNGPSPLCAGDPSRTVFAGGPNTSPCHQFDDDKEACEKAFHIGGQCGAASCYFDVDGNCSGCGPQNEQNGACINTCKHAPPSCPGDPTRTIFAGYANTAGCTYLSYSQTLCEKAYKIDGSGQPASCFWNGDECLGCGPNNLQDGECQNSCPVCEGDPSRSLFTGGPGYSGCHKFDGSQASCEGAFVFSDLRAYNSCYFDADSDECKGCGPNNQADQQCINSCPVCEDASNQIFVGGPGSSACHIFDYNPALCEQAFLMSGECNELASCYFDYDNQNCNGCGPNNVADGSCGNECSIPICGNGVVDVQGEQCDGSAASCDINQVCTFDCLCGSPSAAFLD